MFVIKTVETTKSYDDREKRFVVKRCFNIVVECYKYVIHRFIPPEKIKFSPTVFQSRLGICFIKQFGIEEDELFLTKIDECFICFLFLPSITSVGVNYPIFGASALLLWISLADYGCYIEYYHALMLSVTTKIERNKEIH